MVNVGKYSTEGAFGYSTKKLSLYSPVSPWDGERNIFFGRPWSEVLGTLSHENQTNSKRWMNKISLILYDMGVSKNTGTPKMDGENNGKPFLEWMIFWGFPPYFRKHPYLFILNSILLVTLLLRYFWFILGKSPGAPLKLLKPQKHFFVAQKKRTTSKESNQPSATSNPWRIHGTGNYLFTNLHLP